MAQTGIKPTTIRLVDQCLNQLLHRLPLFFLISLNIFKQTPCFHKLYFIFAHKLYPFVRELIGQVFHTHIQIYSHVLYIRVYSGLVTRFQQIFRFCYKVSTDIKNMTITEAEQQTK